MSDLSSASELEPDLLHDLGRLINGMTDSERDDLLLSAINILAESCSLDPRHKRLSSDEITEELGSEDIDDRLLASRPYDWPGRQIVELDNVGDADAWLDTQLGELPRFLLFGGVDWQSTAAELSRAYLSEIPENGFPLPSDFDDQISDEGWTDEDEAQVTQEFLWFIKHWRETVIHTIEEQRPRTNCIDLVATPGNGDSRSTAGPASSAQTDTETQSEGGAFDVVEEMEGLVQVALTALSNRREYGALRRSNEHLHRLRMCPEATNHTSSREELAWLLSWALESLAHGYTGEAKSCMSDFMSTVESTDDDSLSSWELKDYAARGEEIIDYLKQSTDEARYRAATIMGTTLRKLTLSRSML